MKKILLVLAMAFGALAMGETRETKDIAFLIRQPEHLKAALLTLDQMRQGEFKLDYGAAVLVICGKNGVSSLKKGGTFEKKLPSFKEKQIKVKACGMTLSKIGLEKKDLVEGVEVVKNGLYEMIRLKTEGYVTVDL